MSLNKRHLAVLSGHMPYHLDHLAPFANMMKCPLWIDDHEIAEMAKKYYPDIKIIAKTFDLEEAGEMADILVVTTKNGPIDLKLIYQSMGNDQIKIAYLPHGQSDKGLSDPMLRSIQNTDLAYIYGALQHHRLEYFGSIDTIGEVKYTGNFRYEYYKKYQKELDAITEKEIFSRLDPQRQTLLYAPTWSSEGFSKHTEKLVEKLKGYNLIIKLHPFIEKKYPAQAAYFEQFDENIPHCVVTSSFPLVYPILSKVDIYVGDESAIGYDMLAFNKPMYFITNAVSPLCSCGIRVENVEELRDKLPISQDKLSTIREAFYQKAFMPPEGVEERAQWLTQTKTGRKPLLQDRMHKPLP